MSSATLETLRESLRSATLRPETEASDEAIADLAGVQAALARAGQRAARWVEVARADTRSRPLMERMLEQFPLDSAQGKALMSLAEALLRTPDPKRADQLIAERLASIREAGVPGDTDLLLRTGFALLGAAGRLLPDVAAELSGEFSPSSLTKPHGRARSCAPRCASRCRCSGTPSSWARRSSRRWRAAEREPELALCSFDVLGEGARTEADAQRYFEAYAQAIDSPRRGSLRQRPTRARASR